MGGLFEHLMLHANLIGCVCVCVYVSEFEIVGLCVFVFEREHVFVLER